MIKGILFDKDGTLIDFFSLWQPAIIPVLNQLIKDYHLYPSDIYLEQLSDAIGFHNGEVDPEGASAWKPYQLIAEDLGEIIEKEVKDLDYNLLTQRLQDYFTDAVHVSMSDIPTFTDTRKLFDKLKRMDIAIGIVTTDTFLSTWKTMEDLGLDHFISFVGTSDNSRPIKPNPELLYQAARLWGCDSSEIIVVGDTPNDMRFANNGRAIGVGVTSGTGNLFSLAEYTSYVIPTVAELVPLLEEINQMNEDPRVNY